MSALDDFNTVTTAVLGSLNTAFPTPLDLDPKVIAADPAGLEDASRAGFVGEVLVWLIQAGYIMSRDTLLDPSMVQGATLTVQGFGLFTLPASLQP